MKSTLSTISIITLIAFALLLVVSMLAYPTHLGEPSYYHVARIYCLVAATTCAITSFVSAIAAAHF